ncbi:MAG: hypothetical protein JXR37_27760 [Kiritimatiellae bacterium]|nr:hypothetical protein [Kiritimatiellia bacterium]
MSWNQTLRAMSRSSAGVLVGVHVLSVAARAEVPAAATRDPRFALGYLVATRYPGVDPTGAEDSTAGLQAAIEDAYAQRVTLLIPSGTYRISDTLRVYEWQNWNLRKNKPFTPDSRNHVIRGSSSGNRPLIKLGPGPLPRFDDPRTPCPMIAWRDFVALHSNAVPNSLPAHPLGAPKDFRDSNGNYFREILAGVDFDTSGHPGAIGVTFAGAQSCSLIDVKVTATGSFAGFYKLPGRNSINANIEVIGGRYGMITGRNPASAGLSIVGTAGPELVGITLSGQTEAALRLDDSTPPAVAGFRIVKSTPGAAISAPYGALSLIDGRIELRGAATGSPAIDNPGDTDYYVRNVYVTGTTQLVKSADMLTTGIGAWIHIEEYAYNSQVNVDRNADPHIYPFYAVPKWQFESRSLVNGVVSAAALPSVAIENHAAPPPADLLSRHLWAKLPSFEDGPYVDVREHGATPYVHDNPRWAGPAHGNTGPDDTAAIQAAIDAASAAGHGRVIIPRGTLHISDTLRLHPDTVLIGAGPGVSTVSFHANWLPTAETPMIRTDDSAAATTFLGFLSLYSRTAPFEHGFMTFLDWRAGRRSMTVGLDPNGEWVAFRKNQPKIFARFRGNGGGRHYALHIEVRKDAGNPETRLIRIEGTSEPLSLYGQNAEITKFGPHAGANVEIVGAANVRIYGMKREGASPSVIVRDSRNIALYSSGAMSGPINPELGAFMQIRGACKDILMTNVKPRDMGGKAANGCFVLEEAVTGLSPVNVSPWPNGVSLYKRGRIDDTQMALAPARSWRVEPVQEQVVQ